MKATIAGDFDLAQEVGVQENRGTTIALRFYDVANQETAHWVETGRRLIQKDQLRIVQQRLCQADPLQHTLGEITQPLVGVVGETDYLQKRGGTPLQVGG